MANAITFDLRERRIGPQASRLACARLADLALGGMFLWAGLPDTVVERIYVGEIPIPFFLFYLGSALMGLELLLAGGLRWRGTVALPLAVGVAVLMALLGYLNEAEFRWWAIDASMFAGFLAGLCWVRLRGFAQATHTLGGWAGLSTLLLLGNLIGLATGLIPPSDEGDRVYSHGMFFSANFLAMVFPLWVALSRSRPDSRAWLRLPLVCLGAAGMLAVAFFSATRSSLILSLASLLLTYWTTARKRTVAMTCAAFVMLTIGLVILGDESSAIRRTALANRLSQTTITDEDRYVEVEMMFGDLRTMQDFCLGRGFGSRFWSVVGANGGDWAFAPHVAVLTSWYKGGLFSFVIVLVWPLVQAVCRVFLARRRRLSMACSAALIAYAVMASMSGGWFIVFLFPYGACLELSGMQDTEGAR